MTRLVDVFHHSLVEGAAEAELGHHEEDPHHGGDGRGHLPAPAGVGEQTQLDRLLVVQRSESKPPAQLATALHLKLSQAVVPYFD